MDRRALYGIAGELQVLAYEADISSLYESDLRAATRRNLQIHIAKRVIAEAQVKPASWKGVGGVDIAIKSASGKGYDALLELKLWKDKGKMDESVWDAWKLASAYKESLAPHVYLVAAGGESLWNSDSAMLVYWGDEKVLAGDSWTSHQSAWKQYVSKKAGPMQLPAGLRGTPIGRVPIHSPEGEDWLLVCSKITTTPGPAFMPQP